MNYKLAINIIICLIVLITVTGKSYAQNEPSPSPSVPATTQDDNLKVRYKADRVEYYKEKNLASLIGNVELKSKDVVLHCEQLDMDTKNRIIYTDTPFELTQKDANGREQLIKGKTLEYDLIIKRGIATEAFLEIPAQTQDQFVYIYGEQITSYDNGSRIVVNNGNFTTCKHVQTEGMTHYALSAAIIDYIPDLRIFAWNASIYFMEQRILWFPFFAVPLEKMEYNLDIGKNDVEGLYFRTKTYYYINESHDGWIFNNFMEKKGWGTGFEHVWINNPSKPNFITMVYFYGVPFATPLWPIWDVAKFQGTPFQDRDFMIKHKQLILPNMEAQLMFNDKNFYNISSYVSPRDIFSEFQLSLNDKEIFELNKQLNLNSGLNLNLNYRKGTSEPLITPGMTSINRTFAETTGMGGSLNLGAGTTTANINTSWQQSKNWSEQEFLTPVPSGQPTPQASPNVTKNLTDSIQFNHEIMPSLTFRSNINHRWSEMSSTLPDYEPDHQMDTTFNVSQDLKWGRLDMDINKRFDLTSKAGDETKIKQSNYIDKLPELTLTPQTFFPNTFPVTPVIKVGRIFASSNYTKDNAFNDISRAMFDLNLNASLDLGMGMRVSYGGTSFTQRFYNTTDAEYAFRGQMSISNNVLPFFLPNFTYQRQITDKENNNPLPIDRLGETKSHTLSYNFAIGNIPEFTWNLSSGYDYEFKRYSDFMTNITSKVGSNFALILQGGYTPRNISKIDIDQTNPQNPVLLKDLDGKEIPDLWITENDIGRLELRGGRWSPLSFGVAWRPTEEVFGGGFGLDDNIPQGVELGLALTYDINKSEFQNFYTQLVASIGTDWLWHTEVLVESSFDLNKQKEGFWSAFKPFNKFMLKKDLHDFILIVSYDPFYEQQVSVTLTMLAFPVSTSDISGLAKGIPGLGF